MVTGAFRAGFSHHGRPGSRVGSKDSQPELYILIQRFWFVCLFFCYRIIEAVLLYKRDIYFLQFQSLSKIRHPTQFGLW